MGARSRRLSQLNATGLHFPMSLCAALGEVSHTGIGLREAGRAFLERPPFRANHGTPMFSPHPVRQFPVSYMPGFPVAMRCAVNKSGIG